MLASLVMARRPSREKSDFLNDEELKELRQSLAHLSPEGVRHFYQSAFEDCRLVYNRLPCPRRFRHSSKSGSSCGNGDSSDSSLFADKKAAVNVSAALRRALAQQAEKYALAESIPHCFSYGDAPVCFFPYEGEYRHGNFLDRSYRAIRGHPEWNKRLSKTHTSGKHSLPLVERGRWMELDTCMSSDALLMNVFYPGVLDGRIPALLGAEPDTMPIFGYKARVPLANGRLDRTEVDMRLGDLLVEAKLTEGDFQTADKKTLLPIAISHACSTVTSCRPRMTVIFPTSCSEMFLLLMLCSAHFAF